MNWLNYPSCFRLAVRLCLHQREPWLNFKESLRSMPFDFSNWYMIAFAVVELDWFHFWWYQCCLLSSRSSYILASAFSLALRNSITLPSFSLRCSIWHSMPLITFAVIFGVARSISASMLEIAGFTSLWRFNEDQEWHHDWDCPKKFW